MDVDGGRYVGGEELETDRLWWQFGSGIVMDEWQSRWVGVGGGGVVWWWWIGSQPPSALRWQFIQWPMGWILRLAGTLRMLVSLAVQLDLYRVSCESLALWTKKCFGCKAAVQHERSGANQSAECRERAKGGMFQTASTVAISNDEYDFTKPA